MDDCTPPRIPIIGVMGSGAVPHTERASALGQWLAENGFHLLTGGGDGVMASVSQAFHGVDDRRGLVIGVLPETAGGANPTSAYPNRWVEVPVRTHLPLSGTRGTEPMSRNHINVLTADVIVALPGGAGTGSEVSLALRYGRPVIAYVATAAEIPGLPPEVEIATTLADVSRFVDTILGGGR